MKSATKTGFKRMENEELLRIYFNQIRSIPLLDFEGETELSRLVQKGNKDALHKLITANLRLVVKIARLYMAQNVPFIDLVQEGNMGLIHAAEKYDHMKKVRFCTYASWWIRQFIIRYLTNKRRIVRLPQRKEEMLRRIQHTYHILSQTLMHQPRSEDIAKELGISVHDVDFVINMSSSSLSLEWDGNDRQSNVPSLEFQEDYTYNPEKTFMRNYHREGAWRCLENLKDKEKQVLTYRYQLEGSGPRTLKEIGAKMDISPETVRKIEMRALAKIRSRADELKKHGIMQAI